MIRNIFIVQNGIPLVKLNFGDCHSLGENQELIIGFMAAFEIFAKTVVQSKMESIKMEDYIIRYFKDQSELNLLYVFIIENEKKSDEINLKMQRISSLFSERYGDVVLNFDGNVSRFYNFRNDLINMNLAQKNCGGRPECEGCPNSKKSLKFLKMFKKERMGFFRRLKSKSKS